MNEFRLLIVDDHPLYRQGIRSAFDRAPDARVVAEVGTAEAAIAHCRDAAPDVVILDINLPDRNGVEVARELRSVAPQTGILVLSAHDDEPYVLALAEAGARGYLLKTATDDEIVNAARAVAAGDSVFAPQVTEILLRRVRGEIPPIPEDLTPREREVLRQVSAGRTNREIGHRLGISERTAQAHLSHVFDKLGVSSRTEAVTVALRSGLIDLEDDGG